MIDCIIKKLKILINHNQTCKNLQILLILRIFLLTQMNPIKEANSNLISLFMINKKTLVSWVRFRGGQMKGSLQVLFRCLSEVFINQRHFRYQSVFMVQFVIQILITIRLRMMHEDISQELSLIYQSTMNLIEGSIEKLKNRRQVISLYQILKMLQNTETLSQKNNNLKSLVAQSTCSHFIKENIQKLIIRDQASKPVQDWISRYQKFQNIQFTPQIIVKIQRLFDETLRSSSSQNQKGFKSMQIQCQNSNSLQMKVNRNIYASTFKRLKDKVLSTRNFQLLQKLCKVIKVVFLNNQQLGYARTVKQEHIFNHIFNINDISYFSESLLLRKQASPVDFSRQCPTVQKYLLRQNILNILPIMFYQYKNFSRKQFEQNSNPPLIYSPKLINQLQMISQREIQNALQLKENKIFFYLQTNLARVSFLVFKHFTNKSGFDVRNKVNQLKRKNLTEQLYLPNNDSENHSDHFIFDPLHFLMIKKQYWENQYNAQILATCLWIVSQFWLIQIKRKRLVAHGLLTDSFVEANVSMSNSKHTINTAYSLLQRFQPQLSNLSYQQITKEIQEYQKLQNLVVCQFLLSIPLRQNNTTFNYYFSDSKVLKQICSVSSFATLALSCQSICDVCWNRSLIEQLPKIVFQQNGYLLAVKIYRNKRSFNNYIFDLIINSILEQLKSQKYISSKRKEQIIATLNILSIEKSNEKIQIKQKIQQLLQFFAQ